MTGKTTTGGQFQIEWIDHGREPRCPPNPKYPDGIDIKADGVPALVARCKADLPYPAKRCGAYIVQCRVCGIRVGFTTAGRPDDPRSVEIACLPHEVGTA